MPEMRKKTCLKGSILAVNPLLLGGGRYVGGSIEGEGVGPRLKKGGGGRLEKWMI